MHPEFSRNAGGYYVVIRQLDFEGCVRKGFQNHSFKFDYIIFSQKNHSLFAVLFNIRRCDHALVGDKDGVLVV